MKMIDEKGRLFGRINVIDFLILTILIVLIPVFLHLSKVMEKSPQLVKPQWIKVEAVAFIIPEMKKLLKPGDLSYDEFGNVDGRLIKVLENKGNLKRFKELGSGVPEQTTGILLELDLLCTQSSKNERWYYRREALVVGIYHSFKFISNKYTMPCFALKIDKYEEEE